MRSVIGILATGLLTIGVARNAWPWIVDDAFISLRFADRFANGDGLTWTDGERVEGYSNLLWVLLSAALGSLGVDWIVAVRALGVACTITTFAVLLRSSMVPASVPARLAVCTLASLAVTSVWTIGGLEAPLMMLLVAIAMAGLHRAFKASATNASHDTAHWRRPMLLAGAALALACWTRPDGPLWSVVATVVVWFAGPKNGSRWRAIAYLLALPVAAFLLQMGFRIAYYGDWLPNTGRAKAAAGAEGRRVGWAYLMSAATAMRALLIPAAIGVLALAVQRSRAIVMFATLGTAAWWLYILQMGGDAFPRSRLLVPTLAPLTVLAAHGFDLLRLGGGPRSKRTKITFYLACMVAIASIVVARIDAERTTDDTRQQLSNWEWLGIASGDWLGRAFHQQQPLLAVDAAGAVPFASRLPCLDMLGLCDRTIATTPVPADQPFVPGHSRGNGAYVLSREPDLVMWGPPPGSPLPQWAGDRQMEASPEFLRDYRVLLFQTGPNRLGDGTVSDLRITAWARLQGRIGIAAEGAAILIPGFWLGSYRQPYSFLQPLESEPGPSKRAIDVAAGAQWWLTAGVVGVLDDGDPESDSNKPPRVVGEVRRAGEHVLSGIPLSPGRYQLTPVASPADNIADHAEFELRGNATSRVTTGQATPTAQAIFVVAARTGAPPTVDLVCRIAGHAPLPLRLEAIRIQPAP